MFKKKPARQRELAAAGKVSVWIGDFDREEALLDYIESEQGLGVDFGCVLEDNRELTVEAHALPLRQLLHGFSRHETFVDEIAAQIGAETTARCAVVAYATDYRLLKFTPKVNTPLRLVGVASF